MSDLADFFAAHPVLQPPPERVERDTAMEAFVDTRQHAARTPFGGRRSMRLVDPTVCKVGCVEHFHVGPDFTPDPALDEIGVGWTPQHVPRRPGETVAARCILCWELDDDLALHDCPVGVLVCG